MSNEDNIFELRARGFDFVRGGNSASYILRVFQDHEEKVKELEAKLAEAEKVIAFIDANKDHLAPVDHLGEMCLGKLDLFYKR